VIFDSATGFARWEHVPANMLLEVGPAAVERVGLFRINLLDSTNVRRIIGRDSIVCVIGSEWANNELWPVISGVNNSVEYILSKYLRIMTVQEEEDYRARHNLPPFK
jgi:hypothetical protein